MTKLLVVFSMVCIGCNILNCPIRIKNDTQDLVVIVDPHGTTALCLKPSNHQIIDPSLTSIWYHFPLSYFKKETLYIYLPDQNNLFHLSYIVTEEYCAPGEEQMTLTEIEALVNNPTKRFSARRVAKEHKDHTH